MKILATIIVDNTITLKDTFLYVQLNPHWEVFPGDKLGWSANQLDLVYSIEDIAAETYMYTRFNVSTCNI